MEDLAFGTFVNAMDLTAQKAVGELVEMSCQQEAEAGHPAGLGMFVCSWSNPRGHLDQEKVTACLPPALQGLFRLGRWSRGPPMGSPVLGLVFWLAAIKMFQLVLEGSLGVGSP